MNACNMVSVCFSAFQISALEARLVGYESHVMNLEQQVEEKEVTLVTLKQEVYCSKTYLNRTYSEWKPLFTKKCFQSQEYPFKVFRNKWK